MTSALTAPLDVFIFYSHQDHELREELITHLANLHHQGKITAWHDRAIEAGTDWEAQLKEKLESARIILLLISPPFMASKYCYDIEMKRAIQRHHEGTARVLPIILRPCDWEGSPFRKLQALPVEGKPITLWDNRDSAFLDVVKGIRQAVQSLTQFDTTPDKGKAPSPSWAAAPRVDSPFITGNPISQPSHFFGREKVVKRLFNLLKTHPLQNAAIIGAKRSGKTSLLNYLRTITTTPAAQLRPGQRSDWLPNPNTYRWILVDFQDARMAHREQLLRYLLESMQLPVPYPCDLDRFMGQVSGQVTTPTVILMDEIGVGLQRCPELDDGFWESLRALASNQTGGNLAFVLAAPENPMDLAHHTGHSSPFFNIFGYTTTLKPLTETEVRALIASSPIAFAEGDIAWILEQSGRWPILLQILCRERLFSLEEGDLSDTWQAEGLEQVAPFRNLLQSP
ncbi:MAG: toll/interleukin-1 receptor domain-containing protein [Cyanobacteria bacterium P01_F01_bin.4]